MSVQDQPGTVDGLLAGLSDGSLKLVGAVLSVVTTVILTAGKLVLGLITGSLALLADGLQGLIDVLVTLVTVGFVLISGRAACPAWTLGRERAEAMAALIEAALLALIAACIWYMALQKFVFGAHAAEVELWHLGAIAVAIVVDWGRAGVVGAVARRTGSLALEANAAHFRADSLGSVLVLAGMGLAHWGWPMADSLATLALALFLFWTAWRVGHRAAVLLLDIAEPRQSLAVLAALEGHPAVQAVPVLRMHRRPRGYDVVAEVELTPGTDPTPLRTALVARVAAVGQVVSVIVAPRAAALGVAAE